MGAPAVSPDGSWVLFSATLDGRTAWHLQSLDSTEPPRLLAGTENGYHPFWSPDSRSVGFFEGGHLKIVAIAGGPPTTLCDLPEPTGNQGKGGAWNRNGDIVFAMPRAAPLYRVSQNGGECRQLTTLAEGEESHRWPSFLPDGRHFLYFSRGDETAIYIGSLDSPRRTPVLQGVTTNAVYASGHLLFVDDENLMAQKFDSDDFEKVGEPFRIANPVAFTTAINRGLFNVSDAGVLVFYPGAGANLRQILEYDRSGNLLREVGPPAAYDSIRLSPEGTTLLVGSSPSSRLRVLDLSTGQQSVFNPDMNVTSLQSPVWSATPNQVFFAARSCRPQCALAIYQATPGTVVERVSDKDYGLLPLDASRDGKYLLVLALPQRRPGLRGLFWTAELTPEPTLHKVPVKAYVEREGRLSPDGSMLAYSSDESGAFEVSVRTFPKAESKVVISRGGGRNPVWRGDSNEVVFLSGDRFLTSVTLKNSNSGISIEKTERLFQLPGTQLSGGVGTRPFWDMTPDGRTFFVAEDRERQPPTVITDWTAGVNR
jgi:WD40 repeat protein